jgi:hypothetical protein
MIANQLHSTKPGQLHFIFDTDPEVAVQIVAY